MTLKEIGISKSLRIAGILLLLGLFTEAVSLSWAHPIAFILFFVVGGTLLGSGVLFYLYSLVASDTP